MLTVTIKAFIASESGATAIEYALLATLIGVAIVGTFAALGNGLQALFSNDSVDTIANQTRLMD